MKFKITSIPLLLLLLLRFAPATPRHLGYQDDDSALQPILTRSQQNRVCAELCMSGLGGTPCGEDCNDIAPQGLPLQYVRATAALNYTAVTRHTACDVLCENR